MERNRHLIVGLDPGKTGAIVTGYLDDPEEVTISDLGNGRAAVVQTILKSIGSMRPFSRVSVFLEQSFILPGSAISASETYMKHYGNIEAALLAARIPNNDITELRPQTWQHIYPDLTPPRSKAGEKSESGERRIQIKHNSRRIATRLFPKLARMFAAIKNDGRADAALIYSYGVRKVRGDLVEVPTPAVKIRSSNNGKAQDKSPSRTTAPALPPEHIPGLDPTFDAFLR